MDSILTQAGPLRGTKEAAGYKTKRLKFERSKCVTLIHEKFPPGRAFVRCGHRSAEWIASSTTMLTQQSRRQEVNLAVMDHRMRVPVR
tara:strand:- start:6 stop:269 length:264 start_codon:yes stop_codon:yes gene_type:complete